MNDRRPAPDADRPATETDEDRPSADHATDGGEIGVVRGSAAVRPGSRRLVAAVTVRELRTMIRTRTYLGLAVVLAAVVTGLAVAGGGLSGGYGPVVVDRLMPLEFLVPIVAVAFGYRAIFGDALRGELELFRTYPVAAWQHVLGVYVGRAVGLLVALVAALGVVGALVAVTPTETIHVFATHEGVDSPIHFARFVVLTGVFALVVLALVIAISAAATSTRSALALIAALVVVIVVGVDVALVGALGAEWIDDSALSTAMALSPNSAYRGLVLEMVIGVDAGPRAASPVANVLGLLAWGVGGLIAASVALTRR